MKLIPSFHLVKALSVDSPEWDQKHWEDSLPLTIENFAQFTHDTNERSPELLVKSLEEANVLINNQIFFQPLNFSVKIEEEEPAKEKTSTGVGFDAIRDNRNNAVANREVNTNYQISLAHNGKGPFDVSYTDVIDPDTVVLAVIQTRPLSGRNRMGWRLPAASFDFIRRHMETISILDIPATGYELCDTYVLCTYREIHLLKEYLIKYEDLIKQLVR